MTIRHLFIIGGQSNAVGPNSGGVPVGIPSSDVDYWLRVVGDAATNDNALRDLDVRIPGSNTTHSLELQFGLDLHAAGYNTAILKVARSNTFISEWVPGTGNGNALLSELADFKAAIETAYPTDQLRWHFIWWQGESEAKDATDTAALAWGDNFDLIEAGLEDVVGPLDPLIIKTHSSTAAAPHLAIVQSQQASRAWRLFSVDAVTLNDDPHFTAATYNVIGGMLADFFVSELSTMGTISSYLLNESLDHLLNVGAWSAPATVYFAAFVAGVEVTGGSYARKAETNNTTLFPNAAARVKTNGTQVTFVTAAGANWGTVDEIRIFDASSGGNELARDAVASPEAIDDGDTLIIEAGALDITAPAGAMTDTHVHLMLDHAFGAVAWTAQASTQFAYYDGDPQGAGVEITGTGYTRDTNTSNGTTWAAASGGVIRNLIDFSVGTAGAGDWDEATHWALYDNAGTGLMISAALPVARQVANGETETIQAGRIRVTFS